MKTAIVTGGARGIGLGITRALLADGWKVTAVGRSSAEKVAVTMKTLPGADYVQLDVSDLAAHEAAFRAILDTVDGRIDLWVNNAGIAPRVRADLMEMTPESFDEVMNVNLRGPFFLTQRVGNEMLRAKQTLGDAYSPRIVTVTSMSAYTVSVNRGEYCMSKAALSMACSLYAARLADEGIAVFEIRPGIIATDMTKGVKEKYDKLIAEGVTPIKRWGTPEDIGNMVTLLASGKMDFAAGQVIDADGGFHIRRL